jgi:hypothetical protein
MLNAQKVRDTVHDRDGRAFSGCFACGGAMRVSRGVAWSCSRWVGTTNADAGLLNIGAKLKNLGNNIGDRIADRMFRASYKAPLWSA